MTTMVQIPMRETRVESWNELQDALFADAWIEDLRRFRSRFAFRGLADSGDPLTATLSRLGGDFAALEKHLLRNFRKYAHRSVVQRDSIWHWLSVAQHYGLPTRLMDWTYSPFVALHFATADLARYDRDGVIWGVNYLKTHELVPPRLREQLEREGANVFTVEMLSAAMGSLAEMDTLTTQPFALFFEPPSIDDRIVNQFAFFSVISDPRLDMGQWLRQRPFLGRRIIIPAGLKWEIRDKLDQSNLTERVLFPGLQGLTAWLKRHYSPRASRGRLRNNRYGLPRKRNYETRETRETRHEFA